MMWSVLPILSSGAVPENPLWFDQGEALLVLIGALALSILALLGAGPLSAAGTKTTKAAASRRRGAAAKALAEPRKRRLASA